MNYAWEAALAADRTGIPREEIRYVPVRDGSPYTEVVLEDINSRELGQKNVEINPLYHFAREFSGILDINMSDCENLRLIFLMCLCIIWFS